MWALPAAVIPQEGLKPSARYEHTPMRRPLSLRSMLGCESGALGSAVLPAFRLSPSVNLQPFSSEVIFVRTVR